MYASRPDQGQGALCYICYKSSIPAAMLLLPVHPMLSGPMPSTAF